MSRTKKLVGEKVYLSPVCLEDSEYFLTWMNSFDVTDYTGRSANILTLESEKAWVGEKAQKDDYFMVIVKSEDDKPIGTIALNKINMISRYAELGIYIGENDNRSKGYGTEAILLMLDFAFRYLNLNSVYLNLLACNARAKRCYEKAGFKECGRKRMHSFVNGKYYDSICMDILASEFEGEYIKNKCVK